MSLSLPPLDSAFLWVASFSGKLSPCGGKDTHWKPEACRVLTAWDPEEEILTWVSASIHVAKPNSWTNHGGLEGGVPWFAGVDPVPTSVIRGEAGH